MPRPRDFTTELGGYQDNSPEMTAACRSDFTTELGGYQDNRDHILSWSNQEILLLN